MRPEMGTLDFSYIVKVIIDKKIVVLMSILTCLVLTIIFLNVSDYKYKVTLKLMPVENEFSSPQDNLGGLGMLAKLGGVSIDNNALFSQYMEMLFSTSVSKEILKNEKISSVALKKYWNAEKKMWKEPQGLVYNLSQFVGSSIMGKPDIEWLAPTPELLSQYIQRNIGLELNRDNGILSLITYNKDPIFGRYLLAQMHSISDKILQDRKVLRTKSHISYLQEKLAVVTLTEHRKVLIQNLLMQEHTLMMASSDLPFSAEPFDEPEISPKPVRPSIILSLLSGIIIGLFIGVLLAIYFSSPSRIETSGDVA